MCSLPGLFSLAVEIAKGYSQQFCVNSKSNEGVEKSAFPLREPNHTNQTIKERVPERLSRQAKEQAGIYE
jgi:hypothetical protein